MRACIIGWSGKVQTTPAPFMLLLTEAGFFFVFSGLTFLFPKQARYVYERVCHGLVTKTARMPHDQRRNKHLTR